MSSYDFRTKVMLIKDNIFRNLLIEADFYYIVNNFNDNIVPDDVYEILQHNALYRSDFTIDGSIICLVDRLGQPHFIKMIPGNNDIFFEDVIEDLFHYYYRSQFNVNIVLHEFYFPAPIMSFLDQNMAQLEKCISLMDLHMLLLQCGDIETNPGPVFSKIQAQIGVDVRHTHSFDLSSLFESLNEDVFEQIGVMCEKAGINIGDKMETAKNRTVVAISMMISVYRWSYGLLATPDLINSLTTSLLIAVPATTIGRAMKLIFSGITAQSENFQPQVILKALCVIFFLITCSKLPGKGTIDEFILRIRNIPQALKSLENFWELIGPITKELQRLLEKYVLGYDTSAVDCEFIGQVQSWADDVALYSDMYKKRLINRSSEAMDEAARLHPRGIKLAQECVHNQYDRKNLELIRSLLPTSFKISEFALKSGADQCSVRPEPVIVWFQGDSGVGKSTLLYPFIQDMMKATKIGCDENGELEKDWQKRIYARMPETKFWSGYNPYHHDVIIIDEAFQLRDSALNPSPELFEIIRLGNMFPYMLYMDSIEQKANTFSRAKLIVLTSNTKNIKIESLNCPEAVKRRITRAYTTELKEEYRLYYEHAGFRKYRLDREKIDKAMDVDIYSFQQFDTMTLDDIGPPAEYPIMLYDCAQVLIKNLRGFNRYDEALEQNRTRPLPELTTKLLEATAQVGDDDEFFDAIDGEDWMFHPKPVTVEDEDRQWKWKQHQEYKHPSGLYIYTDVVKKKNIPSEAKTTQTFDFRIFGHENFEDVDGESQWIRDTIIVPPTHRAPIGLLEGMYNNARLMCMMGKKGAALCLRPLINRGYFTRCTDFVEYHLDPTNLRYDTSALHFIKAYDLAYSERFHKEPYDGVIFGQVGEDGEMIFPDDSIVNKARKKYESWVEYFKKKYRETRFNLPSLTAKAIGLAVLIYWNRGVIAKLCHVIRPRRETLQDKFTEMQAIIDKAEACAKKGCDKCKTCNKVTEEDLVRLDYWGVTCKCYALECDKSKQKHKRMFVAYLDQHRQKTIETSAAKAQMCDFVRTCVCERCPLCIDAEDCECLRLAIQRGCTIDEINLVDKTGLYETICGQSKDPRTMKQQTIRVQSKDPKVVQQPRVVVQSKEPNTQRQQVVRVQGNVVSQARDIASDMQCEAMMNNVVYSSLLWMYVAGENDDVIKHRLGHVMMIKGKVALMNWHFIMALRELSAARIVLRTLHGTVFAVLSPSDLVDNAIQIGNKDACLVHLDKKGIQFRDLTKHFVSKEQRMSLITESLVVARYNVTAEDMRPYPIVVTDATLRTEEMKVEFDFQGREHSFICPVAWEYNAPTLFGDCGAPLILHNSRIPTKIIGIHNARSQGSLCAFGVPLYREEIVKALQSFPATAQFGWVDDLEMQTVNVHKVLEGDTFIVMQTQKGQLPQANQSQVKPSPIFGKFIKTATKPGPLREFEKDGVKINPSSIARAKWGGLTPELDPEYAAQADEVVRAMCLRSNPKEYKEYTMPLTYEEAVVGIPGVDHIESINKISSPGYPYVLNKAKGKGKTGYFGKFDFDLTTPEAKQVKADVDEIERKYLNNERPFIVWIDTLKDQRIPIEKADAGKTRVFTAGPMHYTILFRKHVLPFIAHLNANRIDNMFGPGINPLSGEWHKLANLLRSKGTKCIAGDYKQWDGWAPTRGFESFYDAALEWYRLHWDEIVVARRNVVQGRSLTFDEYCDFFRNMVQDVISHIHLCNKEIDGEMFMLFYLVTNGVPSGCPATANKNSACNLWAISYCFFEIFAGTEMATTENFFRFVYSIYYGDDIAMNISDVIAPYFNQVTLTEAMKRNFNLTFTDEAKTGEIVPYRTLEEITFLKRSFRFDQTLQMYVAPLPEELLLDILNWVRVGGENPYVITIHNLQGVLGEMSLLGKEYYDKWKVPFMKTLATLSEGMNIVPCLDSYFGYINKVRAGRLGGVDPLDV